MSTMNFRREKKKKMRHEDNVGYKWLIHNRIHKQMEAKESRMKAISRDAKLDARFSEWSCRYGNLTESRWTENLKCPVQRLRNMLQLMERKRTDRAGVRKPRCEIKKDFPDRKSKKIWLQSRMQYIREMERLITKGFHEGRNRTAKALSRPDHGKYRRDGRLFVAESVKVVLKEQKNHNI